MIRKPSAKFYGDVVYPANFPCPLRADYSFTATPEVEKMTMQTGWTMNRRDHPYLYRKANLSFRMGTELFKSWHSFVHANAFKWFSMNLQTQKTADIGRSNTEPEVIRFVSGITWSFTRFDIIDASVECEFYLDQDTTPLLPMSTRVVPTEVLPDGY